MILLTHGDVQEQKGRKAYKINLT